MKKSFITLFVLHCLVSHILSSRILGIFPFEARSHFSMMETFMKGLTEKGHDVVVVSQWPQQKPIPNYTDRSLLGSRPVPGLTRQVIQRTHTFWGIIDRIFIGTGTDVCEDVYPHPVIQDLIHGDEKFDIMINELWGSDCFLPLAHKLNIPHISVLTTGVLPWAMDRYGNPFNPAYETTFFTYFRASGMDFTERLLNTLMITYVNIRHYFVSEMPSDAIVRKYLGSSIPPLRDIVRNSSLLLVNSHFSVNHPRPFVPNVVEVAGLHISKLKPLPQELQSFLDNSKTGIILFSLGSLLQLETFGEDKIEAILSVFGSLEYDILWKFGGNITNTPTNLRILKWLPQRDILSHPNVKLFITHGGLMGTQEALVGGVPMLVIPFLGDQFFNAETYVDLGIAEQMFLEDLSRDIFSKKINEILNNKSYAEKAQFISQIFKDRPQSALETAIYWTEYVIRYKGAPHLNSAAKNLHWFQSSLLDVYSFLLIVLLVTVFIISKICSGMLILLGFKNTVKEKVQ